VTTDPIDDIPPEACPNDQWTPSVADVTFGDIDLSFFQAGQEVLQIHCELVDGQYECVCS
jgi:hypothetical protein